MDEYATRANAIPDLGDLKPITLLFVLRHTFPSAYSKDQGGYGLTMNLIRSTDMAVRYYRMARDTAFKVVGAGNEGVYLDTIVSADFESCLVSLARANGFLRKLREYDALEPRFRDAIPGGEEVLTDSVEKEIRRVRNDIQHFDERLIDEKVVIEGQPLALWATEGGLEIGAKQLPYQTVAGWLRSMHRCARAVSRA